MPILLTTSSATVPADISAALRDLTAACRAWPSPLNLHGGPGGGPVFLPPGVGRANEVCGHILRPHQCDQWLYVLGAFALLGLISVPMWLVGTNRLMRSCTRLIVQTINRGRGVTPHG